MARVWWVNQSQKIKGRIPNEMVWSPYAEPGDKQEKWHWRTMWDVMPGDTIIHFSNQHIVAVSEATSEATPAANPYAGDDESQWINSGKRIEVKMGWLETPIAKDEIPLGVRQRAYENRGPFQRDGESVKLGYFFPVGDELWHAILALKDHVSAPTEEEADAPIGFDGSSDIATLVNARKEQPQLRARLLSGGDTGTCGICGRTMPSRYLRAAHIKQRSTASEAERHDPNIAMLACVLGCDQAFECGDVTVDKNGVIALGNPADPFLQDTFGSLVSKTAPAFNERNARYFAARAASRRR